MNVGHVLARAFPHLKEWVCTDGTYEGLIWLPGATGPKPTLKELEAAWAAYVPPPKAKTIEERVAALESRVRL